ncbi:hypothetical protein [Bartonella ancashensis]|uniref:Flagellar FliJ protein n=1 Tax=Bartonella ancashensis TaxID=1318743 RepID=A0A0M4LRS8_9HYPH|nr:hypothetical protein [Bartonella ancashensis]ALE02984.1 hypothetical protein PU02_0170 [Bartonella ancashensis]
MKNSKRYGKLVKIQGLVEAYHKVELERLHSQISFCEEETHRILTLMGREEEGIPFWDVNFLSRRLQHTAKMEQNLEKSVAQKKQVVREASSRLQRFENKYKEAKSSEERKDFSAILEDYIADKTIRASI